MSKVKEYQRFLPIEDEVILVWRILTPEEKSKRIASFEKEISDPHKTSDLLAIEPELFDLVQRITHRDPDIARALHLLNRKLNLIEKDISGNPSQFTLLDELPQPVILSASNIVFETAQALPLGVNLQMEMKLLPEKTYSVSYGVVISCEELNQLKTPDSTPIYKVTLEFTAMHEDDVKNLIDHILRKEDKMLEARQQRMSE